MDTNNNFVINFDEPSEQDMLYVWGKMGHMPSKTSIHTNLESDVFRELVFSYFPNMKNEVMTNDIIPINGDVVKNTKFIDLLFEDTWISYLEFDINGDFYIDDITIFHKPESYESIYKFVSDVSEISNSTEDDVSIKDSVLSVRDGILETSPVYNEVDYEFIELFYTKSTYVGIKKVLRSLKYDQCGINILYGQRGLGKTECIKYITTKVEQSTLFIPNNLIEQSINNPEFRSIISNYDKLIILMDDCEFLTNSQFSKMNHFTSNLMQLVESYGNLDIHFILIFNENEDKIDQNIVESNSIKNIVKFENLSTEEAIELNNHLNLDGEITNPMKVRDVINPNRPKRRHIGL